MSTITPNKPDRTNKKNQHQNESPNPPLSAIRYDLMDINSKAFIRKFNKGKTGKKRLNNGACMTMKVMARFYASQLNELLKVERFTPETVPAFATYVGAIAAEMEVSERTVRNRLNHLERCGAVISRRSQGAYGLRMYLHPEIVFTNQKGYAHFTGTTEKTYVSDQTGTIKTDESHPEKNFSLDEKTGQKPDSVSGFLTVNSEKFSSFSSCQEHLNTNTTDVNKLVFANPKQLYGVDPKNGLFASNQQPEVLDLQHVLPVPCGKGENSQEQPQEQSKATGKKNEDKAKQRQKNRSPHKKNLSGALTSAKKDNSGGAGRAFLLQLIESFWHFAKKRLYPEAVLIPAEEKQIKNHIWATVFHKLPEGHSEQEWRDFQIENIKKVEKAARWLEENPSFALPDPCWYFHPKNDRGIGFYKITEWYRQDKNRSVMSKIRKDINLYARGKGRDKDREPLELFRKHEKFIRSFQDKELLVMFDKVAKQGTLYQFLKRKQKANLSPERKRKNTWLPSIPEAFINFKPKMETMNTTKKTGTRRGTMLQLQGKHRLVFGDKIKRWDKAMSEVDFKSMLKKINQDYPCKINILERPSGSYFVTVKHKAGTTDKRLATPIE